MASIHTLPVILIYPDLWITLIFIVEKLKQWLMRRGRKVIINRQMCVQFNLNDNLVLISK